MTRSELIAALVSRFPGLTKDAKMAIKEFLDAVGNALAHGDRAEIRGFGSFGLNYRPPCTGRNPQSGESVRASRPARKCANALSYQSNTLLKRPA